MMIPSSVRYGTRIFVTPVISPHTLVPVNDENGDLVGWFSPGRSQKSSPSFEVPKVSQSFEIAPAINIADLPHQRKCSTHRPDSNTMDEESEL